MLANKQARIKYLNRRIYRKRSERSKNNLERNPEDTTAAKGEQQPGFPIPALALIDR